jgi:hypothetical protein
MGARQPPLASAQPQAFAAIVFVGCDTNRVHKQIDLGTNTQDILMY